MNDYQLNMIYEDCEKIIQGVGSDIFNIEGRTIIITGAGGMLPSFFIDTIALLNRSYFNIPCKVIAITRLTVTEKDRLGHLLSEENIEFITQDVSLPFDIKDKAHYIIHAASKASPKNYLSDPIGTINSNVNGLKTLLEYSIKNKLEGFLYFSSGEIYGNPESSYIPTPENYEGKVLCTGQRSCYTETKRFCETMAVNYSKVYGIPVKIVRPWHVFGPGMRLNDGRVIADFINEGINGRDIVLLSDGLATRAFCYITDAHIGFWKVLLSKFNGEAFNIGNDNPEIKIKDLAQLMCKLFDNKISCIFNSEGSIYLKDSPFRCCPSIDKARILLNYKPAEELEDWLARMIDWYMKG